ncbi:hypothetical protein CDAR_451991 [Caerostris darwini]|uniref:Uncharacterized protein n=1 Tax=Caerostris darwini TaxID=1538125 RepID=A0AAV4WVF3_9ARAC|nr:hypothetical protein CDAR_451991 [Caerostris darwini]
MSAISHRGENRNFNDVQLYIITHQLSGPGAPGGSEGQNRWADYNQFLQPTVKGITSSGPCSSGSSCFWGDRNRFVGVGFTSLWVLD